MGRERESQRGLENAGMTKMVRGVGKGLKKKEAERE